VGAASSREYRIGFALSWFIAAGSRSHKVKTLTLQYSAADEKEIKILISVFQY